MGATPDPRRDAVLADVRAGMSIREAGEKHGVPKTTATRWVGGAHGVSGPAVGRSKAAGASKAGVDARRGEHVAEASTVAHARARSALPIVEALGPELRRDLRRGVSGIARFIAQAGERVGADGKPIANPDAPVDGDDFPDWQQVAHAARALDILVARVPDLMTFDETTAAKQEADAASDAVSDKLRSAIQRKHARPPATTLTLVESITKAG